MVDANITLREYLTLRIDELETRLNEREAANTKAVDRLALQETVTRREYSEDKNASGMRIGAIELRVGELSANTAGGSTQMTKILAGVSASAALAAILATAYNIFAK